LPPVFFVGAGGDLLYEWSHETMKKSAAARIPYRWIIAIAALLMVALGVAGGEMVTVFKKAVNVCLECIGIG
jgi:hypothetical protein